MYGMNGWCKNSGDCISRQAAVDALRAMQTYKLFAGDELLLIDQAGAQTELMMLPAAQPQQIDLDIAYMRGKTDGIKECTEKLKKMQEENGWI